MFSLITQVTCVIITNWYTVLRLSLAKKNQSMVYEYVQVRGVLTNRKHCLFKQLTHKRFEKDFNYFLR